MIDFLEGSIEDLKENYVILNLSGVGFKVFISFPTYEKLKEKQSARVLTFMMVREDSIDLYGFYSQEEKDIFLQLISVSGIGPKAAMSILSNITVEQFKEAILSGDEKFLMRIPRLGSKKAQRILVELKDKFKNILESSKGILTLEDDSIEALTVLGFKYFEAKKAVREVLKNFNGKTEKETIIKEALKYLSK